MSNAVNIVEEDLAIQTPDGTADCVFVRSAEGRHPAVIVWPDIYGLRESFRAIGRRLALENYSVLVVNLFYRTAQGAMVPEGARLNDPAIKDKVMPLKNTLSPETCLTDGRAFVRFLEQHPSVDTDRQMGVMGYCLTGSYALRLAADMPDRIGAAASFHGGGLVTDSDDSPHLLAPLIKAAVLIAIAENDDERDPNAKSVLRDSFNNAEVAAEIEVYKGAMHGWCPADTAAHNKDQAERAWERMLEIFNGRLG